TDKIYLLAYTPADLERVRRWGAAARARSPQPGLLGPYVLIGYPLMTPPLSSPEPPHSRLRPDRASGSRQVLTNSSPAPLEAATPLVQMPPAAAPRDLAYP